MLHRYWFKFDLDSVHFSPFHLGSGVTGYSLDDAKGILVLQAKRAGVNTIIDSVIEDIDISTLDQNHILPNIGLVSNRGMWYPNLQHSHP